MDAGRNEWSLDREIVLTRVFSASRPLVFDAFTQTEHLNHWYGPKGFTITTHEADIRVGGRWRFDMRGPDGTKYPSRMVYLEIKKPERLVMEYGADVDHDPARFLVTITFDEQSDKKTVVTMRQLHPTKEQRAATIGFGAVELGMQTYDKLEAYLQRT